MHLCSFFLKTIFITCFPYVSYVTVKACFPAGERPRLRCGSTLLAYKAANHEEQPEKFSGGKTGGSPCMRRMDDRAKVCSDERPKDGRSPDLSSSSEHQVNMDTIKSGLLSLSEGVDNGSMCVSSMSSAMDTLKSTMERMVLCVDNAKAAQEKLETLFSSGLLKPFTEHLLDQIQVVICGKTSGPFHIEQLASDPVIPPTRVINRRLAMDKHLQITWAYTQKVVRSLLREVLIAVYTPWANNEKDFKTSPRPSAKVCADVVDIFTRVFVQQVMASLAERQADCSSLSSSTASHSSLTSDITSIQSVSPPTPSPDSQGNSYRCLVTSLVMKLLMKISQAKKEEDDLASIPVLSRVLTRRVLFELCAMSGVSKSDAYPPTLAIQKVYQDVYNKLVAEFGSEKKLKRALCAQQLSFSKSLVSLLCDELLKQCHKKVSDLSSLNRKVTTANSKHTASLYQTQDSERKITTKASPFLKGVHTLKKFFHRSNQVRPDGGVAC